MPTTVLWPAYFDATKPRNAGRRVAESNALDNPTVDRLAAAVQQVGYDATVQREKSYSREPVARGRVLVEHAGEDSKTDIIQAVAAYAPLLDA